MDRDRLRQVFENLIDNAIQHSTAGHAVTVSAHEARQGNQVWVECAIEDEGRGFTTDDLPQVFEPFFTRRQGGTGLGLSIVQRIVEQHAGRVTAANRPQGGARLTVRLPRAEPA
jgi:signal transduction histidine kinase